LRGKKIHVGNEWVAFQILSLLLTDCWASYEIISDSIFLGCKDSVMMPTTVHHYEHEMRVPYLETWGLEDRKPLEGQLGEIEGCW
jgi:hypothetical protein